MKEMTIKCPVDSLGRIVLPVQYRRALGIEVKEEVNMIFKNNGMFVYKEDASEVLKRKIDDIVNIANECTVLNGNEREELEKILSKLM